MTTTTLTPADLIGVAVRRKWLILAFLVFSVAVAFAVALIWPKSFRSSTTILIESQKVPETYVKGVVSGTIQERLASVRQMVFSRPVLGQIAKEVALVKGNLEDPSTMEAVVQRMKKNIEVEISREQSTLRLSFADSNPVFARDVTSKIATFVLEDNLRRREQLFEGATEFLQEELKMAKRELEGREKAISVFKSRYMGELPQQMEANLRALDRLQVERTTSSESINALSSRLDSLEKAIRDFKAGDSETGTVPLGAPIQGRAGRVDGRLAKLRDLEQRLATLQAEYKESYPDIISLREEIRRLRSVRDDSDSLQQEEIVGKETGDLNQKKKADAIVDPYLNDLMIQRAGVKHELEVQRQRQVRIAQQIAEFEGRVERTPAREQELVMLNRDYENLQKNYQSLLDKRLSASISENLERRQKGEQFRIMDPAFLPQKPEKPNELLIMLCGLVFGLGTGYGCAFWLEHGRGMVRVPGEAEMILGFPILGTIPDLNSAISGGASRQLPRPIIAGESKVGQLSQSGAEMAAEGKRALAMPRRSIRNHSGTGYFKTKKRVDEVRYEMNMVAKWNPNSLAAEQYRVAATKLLLANSDHKSTVIIVTSSVKGEGKSVSVGNLGYELSRDLGKRTLLIDCDFKHPSLHRYLGVTSSPGLLELLTGQRLLSDCLRSVGDTGLWVLTIGARGKTTADLAEISKIKPILRDLRGQFDYIVLDAPPVLPLADMNLLADLADFLVFVVRADLTQKSAVETAAKNLSIAGRAGVLVTGYTPANQPHYLHGYYYSRQ